MTENEIVYCASSQAVRSAAVAYQVASNEFPNPTGLASAFVAAHHPSLGKNRSVCLRDVLDLLEREYHPQLGENPTHPYDVIYAAFGAKR